MSWLEIHNERFENCIHQWTLGLTHRERAVVAKFKYLSDTTRPLARGKRGKHVAFHPPTCRNALRVCCVQNIQISPYLANWAVTPALVVLAQIEAPERDQMQQRSAPTRGAFHLFLTRCQTHHIVTEFSVFPAPLVGELFPSAFCKRPTHRGKLELDTRRIIATYVDFLVLGRRIVFLL